MEKRLDGFGEIFRALSFQEIGPAAMLSRACAGVALARSCALPGSEHAVRLAVGRLLLPELATSCRGLEVAAARLAFLRDAPFTSTLPFDEALRRLRAARARGASSGYG